MASGRFCSLFFPYPSASPADKTNIEVNMSIDFSASVQGIRTAWGHLDRIAHRVAAGSVNARHDRPPGVSGDLLADGEPASSTMQVDIAGEMVAMSQAKIEVKANLKVVSVLDDLSRESLDILA